MNHKKVKHLKDGEYRVIRISEEAVRELAYETIIDRLETYFDVLDMTKFVYSWQWDEDTGDLTFLIEDDRGNELKAIQSMPDLDEIAQCVGYTTESMYRNKRYKTVRRQEDGSYVVTD